MRVSLLGGSLAFASLARPVVSGNVYRACDTTVGYGFFDAFEFEAIPDPTHGRVNYVDRATAQKLGLTVATDFDFILRADDTTVLKPDGPGRDSVRIRSVKTYTTHVAVFDLKHMPEGCGTWPAIWETLENGWPKNGEVDILEGVNNVAPNQVHLHTTSNCSIPRSIHQLGTLLTTNCDTAVNFNSGCGSALNYAPQSFGPKFNSQGGGWFAVERTETYISVWYWGRWDPRVPYDVRSGLHFVDTSGWGTPSAHFPDTKCNLASHFGPNNIIINLTFCGDWAGNAAVYKQSGCPLTCVDFVNDHPHAFSGAYFQFSSIRVYE